MNNSICYNQRFINLHDIPVEYKTDLSFFKMLGVLLECCGCFHLYLTLQKDHETIKFRYHHIYMIRAFNINMNVSK